MTVLSIQETSTKLPDQTIQIGEIYEQGLARQALAKGVIHGRGLNLSSSSTLNRVKKSLDLLGPAHTLSNLSLNESGGELVLLRFNLSRLN